MAAPIPQISVLDTGGQYCHLIARKIRELGVYCDIVPSETPAAELASRKGLIISGGPSSVYEPASPQVDPAIFAMGRPVLGICYGLQLMAYHLGGSVRQGDRGEYGLAYLDVDDHGALLLGLQPREQIWMSHRDVVEAVPPGFAIQGRTATCAVAAMADSARSLYGVQFHPEVVHTARGQEVLFNFVFGVCGCQKDWHPTSRIPAMEEQIRAAVGDRSVLFFVSGGVDSTVAYTLCLRALGPERVHGYYVDTGFMREGETEFVRQLFHSIGATHFDVIHAERQFVGLLSGTTDPEEKRHHIGEQFVTVQERILEGGHYLGGEWMLGQGTIYPDTIESGGAAKADLIKTHHNRVAGIQKLMASGRVVEPLSLLYKDEVRAIGRELGLPHEFLDRHPFPGPGLAIRCLCSAVAEPVVAQAEGWVLPVRSVGVQGDCRTYRPVLAVAKGTEHDHAVDLTNRLVGINRVVSILASHAAPDTWVTLPAPLLPARLERLRQADAIVRAWSLRAGFEQQVWQFPVILIPIGTEERPDSVVLRPVSSVDGMTAQAVGLPETSGDELQRELLAIPGVCAVLLDLTHKPPGTIEWE